MIKFKCLYCEKSHIWRVHGDGRDFISSYIKGIESAHKKLRCEKCQLNISVCNYDKHYRSCKGKVKKPLKVWDKAECLDENEFRCKICNKTFSKNGIGSHVWRSHTKEGKNFKSGKGKTAWNKGLTAKTNGRIAKASENSKLFHKKHPGVNSRKHTEEEKLHLSKVRKEFLKNNPDKVPYLLNHSSKESYPEKYFDEVFRNENFNTIRYFRISLYEIDFAVPGKKVAIEIDGEQHYLDENVKKCDDNKNKYLNNLGWKIYRIRWSEYQKLSKNDKRIFVRNLIKDINGPFA